MQTRGRVHAVAVDVVAVDDHFAERDADAVTLIARGVRCHLATDRCFHRSEVFRGLEGQALVGLAASHTRAHVIRAVLEGVAFSLKDSFTIFDEMKVPLSSVRLGGGGARSPLWRQIQTDVYNYPAEIVEAEEGAAYGAALLAGVGGGVWTSVYAACDAVVRVKSRFTPDEAAEFSGLKNGLHANAAETSAILAIDPQLVDRERANAEFPPFPSFTVANTAPVHTAFFFTSPGSVYWATKSGT